MVGRFSSLFPSLPDLIIREFELLKQMIKKSLNEIETDTVRRYLT